MAQRTPTVAASTAAQEVPAGYGLLPFGKRLVVVRYVNGTDAADGYRPLSEDGRQPAEFAKPEEALRFISRYIEARAAEEAAEKKRQRRDREEAHATQAVAEHPATDTNNTTPLRPADMAQGSLF